MALSADGGVAAVVLLWNDAARVAALVRALEAQARPPDVVIVVDNGSAPGCRAALAHLLAGPGSLRALHVLGLERNAGFAAAANRGLAAALEMGASWAWLLNPDLVLPPRALENLLAAAAPARVGMAAPVLVERDGRVQARGGGRLAITRGLARHVTAPGEEPDYLVGACLLLSAAMLREIGLFDEGYFFSWEDIDLSRRARAASWRLAVADDCRVVHDEGSSLGRWSAARWRLLFAGLARYASLHAPRPRLAVARALARHTVSMLAHGRLAAALGAWQAVLGDPGLRDGDVPRHSPLE